MGMSIMSILVILYAIPLFTVELNFLSATAKEEFLHYKLYSMLKPMLPILKKQIPEKSIIIAGERISNMLPAFADYYVINGAASDTPDYPKHVEDVNNFYHWLPGNDAVTAFLKKYNASAVIFGADSISYYLYPQADYPHFVGLYDTIETTLVKVEIPK
jgi:hypothetical protein